MKDNPNEPDRLATTACMMTPLARVVEPRLTAPRNCGAVLLFERGQVHVVMRGALEAVDAWIGGRRLLRQRCIALPVQPIPDRFVSRFGDEYRGGSFLRVSAATPPPIFGKSGETMHAADVRPGSLAECAVSYTAGINGQSQRVVRATLEWVEMRSIPVSPDPAWTVVALPDT